MRMALAVVAVTGVLVGGVRGADVAGTQPAGTQPNGGVDSGMMQRVYEEVKTPFTYGVVMQEEGGVGAECPSVYRFGGKWFMVYASGGEEKAARETCLAESGDLLHWTKVRKLLPMTKEGWDAGPVVGRMALVDPTWGGMAAPEAFETKYWMSYTAGAKQSVGMAWTGALEPAEGWDRLIKPLFGSESGGAEEWDRGAMARSVVVHDRADRTGAPFVMYYKARIALGEEGIGMAVSADLETWSRYPAGKAAPLLVTAKGATGGLQVVRMTLNGREVWAMFHAGAGGVDTFAASYDLVRWTPWEGEALVKASPGEPWVLKYQGVVYHFYGVSGEGGRAIAVATSRDLKAGAATQGK